MKHFGSFLIMKKDEYTFSCLFVETSPGNFTGVLLITCVNEVS